MKKQVLIISIIGVFLLIQPISAQIWQGTKRLTYNSGSSRDPAIAVGSSNHIHVVWQDRTHGNSEIYYKRSTNGGTTWTTKRMTYSVANSTFSDVAVDSNNYVHVVWGDATPNNFEIFYRRSTDGGETWNGTERLTWNAGDSNNPAVAVNSGGRVNVVWHDDTPGNSEIYYKRRIDGKIIWTGAKRLTWDLHRSYNPAIAVDITDNIHVAWNDDIYDGNYEIYYKRSTDGGTTWPKFKRLTQNAGDSQHPDIAVDSSNTIHVVWYDETFIIPEIFYRRSTNGGETWDNVRRLTWNAGSSEYPAIAADSSNRTHVVWQDISPGNYEIYYKRSTNGGSTWSKYKRLTWNSGPSYNPDIALDSSNNIHVVWADVTPGNFEIYYKKGIQ
jgi:hypothetical protein